MSTFSAFHKAYTKASDDTKSVIDSDRISHFLDKLIEAGKLKKELKPKLVELTSDMVLSLIEVDDLFRELKALTLTSEDVEYLIIEIRKFSTNPYQYMNTEAPLLANTASGISNSDDSGVTIKSGESITFTPTSVQSKETAEVVSAPLEQETTAETLDSKEESAEEPTVKPLRTMEHDMDRIHGYGAYRQTYPEAATQNTDRDEETAQDSESLEAASDAADDPVVKALSQDDTLSGKTNLASTPSYTKRQ